MLHFDLSQDIELFLQDNPNCREYDIIRHLQAIERLPKNVLNTSLSMFRCHFLVFNALHRIKIKWQKQAHSPLHLSISSLAIDVSHNSTNPNMETDGKETDVFDPLSAFYLDLSQLNQTQETDVNALLDTFWQRYLKQGNHHPNKQQALETLELTPSVDFATVKKQYRRLAMKHHPDRGGDEQKLIAINEAMAILEACY